MKLDRFAALFSADADDIRHPGPVESFPLAADLRVFSIKTVYSWESYTF
jgi:hypothetical protein